LIFITLCWIIAIILVNPLGEFPAVDDWAYLTSVRALVEHGELTFSNFAAQNLLSHILWGSLFAFPFGVSYTTLRFSTLIAALLGAFALYKLLRDVGQSVSMSLFAALILLFNPISFALSFTFMTDIPFVAAQTGAMLLLLAGLKSDSRTNSAGGWFLTVVGQLSRQNALGIPLAYAGAYLAKHGFALKRLAIAILPIAAFVLLQLAYQHWLSVSGRMPISYGQAIKTALPRLAEPSLLIDKLWDVAVYVFFYIGLFLLPLSIPLMASLFRTAGRHKGGLVALGLVSAAIGSYAINAHLVMPIWPHTWHHSGLGADARDFELPLIVRQLVTLFSTLGGVLLAAGLAYGIYDVWVTARFRGNRASQLIFGVLGAAIFAGSIGLANPIFDRYLLPLIPCISLALCCSIPRERESIWALLLAAVLLTVMIFHSIIAAHNYTADKRTRSAAVAYLTAQGIPRDTIDATWVFNGEHAYANFGDRPGRRWYRYRDYVVGPGWQPKRKLLRSFTVPRWSLWSSRERRILVFGPSLEESPTSE
jgi:hypothetical protein